MNRSVLSIRPLPRILTRARAHSYWEGLNAWRQKGIDRRLGRWNEKNQPVDIQTQHCGDESESLVSVALKVLTTPSPNEKQQLTHQAWESYQSKLIPLHGSSAPQQPPLYPSRPSKPTLVRPKDVPSIGAGSPLSPSGHILHNLAHIELNAIDLAMDTVVRFASLGLPDSFYLDFFRVADDESRHLGWCLSRMEEIGCQYGDMPAHDLLWEGAMMSSHDLDARLCIIPCGQEARGLDAGSRLAQRLTGFGDKRTAAIVNQIALEERAHVAVGVYWHKRVCEALGLDPQSAFRSNLSICPELLKGPFNHNERELVGLTRGYYDVEQWPEEARRVRALPSEAAKQRGLGETLDTTLNPQDPVDPTLIFTQISPGEALAVNLKDRLQSMLEMEVGMTVGQPLGASVEAS